MLSVSFTPISLSVIMMIVVLLKCRGALFKKFVIKHSILCFQTENGQKLECYKSLDAHVE